MKCAWLKRGIALLAATAFGLSGAWAQTPEDGNGPGVEMQAPKFRNTADAPPVYFSPQPAKHPFGSNPRETYSPDQILNRTDHSEDIGGLFDREAPPLYNSGFQTLSNTGWIPSDVNVAKGVDDCIVVTNSSFAIYDLAGNLQYQNTFNSFITDEGVRTFFDPKVIWDRYNNRYVIVVMAKDYADDSDSAFWVMYSDDATALGNWGWRSINARDNAGTDVNYWLDYGHIGLTSDGLCYSARMFGISGGASYNKTWFFRLSELYGAGGMGNWQFWGFDSDGSEDYYVLPAYMLSNPGVFVLLSAKNGGSDTLTIRRVSNYTFVGGGPTVTEQVINVGTYGSPPNAIQQGTATTIEAIDARLLGCAYYSGRLYGVHNVTRNDGTSNRIGCRFYAFNYSNTAASTTLDFSTNYGAAGLDYYYPAIVCNQNQDIGMVFARSGATEYAAIRYTGIPTGNTGFDGSSLLRSGEGVYVDTGSGTRNRWGDYFGISLDDTDDRTFWIAGQYARIVSGDDQWATWTAAFNYKAYTSMFAYPKVGQIGETVTLQAQLTESVGGAVIAGRTVTFKVNGSTVGSASTNASGVASLNYVIPTTTPGTRTIEASFAGDTTYNDSIDTSLLTINQAVSTFNFTQTAGTVGANSTWAATMTRTSDGAPLVGYTITFWDNGVQVGSDITDATGLATMVYKPLTAGSHAVEARFAGSGFYTAFTDPDTWIVAKANTAAQIAPESGQVGQTLNLLGQLIRTTDSQGLAGKTLSFSVNGVVVGTAVTNASGFAQRSYTISLPAGTYPMTVSFAGDTDYNAIVSGSASLTVSKSSMTIAVGTVNGTIGSSVPITANLSRNTDSAGIAGRTLNFKINGVLIGSAVTVAGGNATVNYVVPAGTLGAQALSVEFAGDTFYLAAVGNGTFNRYANSLISVPNRSGQRTTTVALSATLTRAHDGALLTGRTVNFSVDGSGVGSAVTNASGVATFNYVIPAAATLGAHTITAAYAGEAFVNPVSGNGTLTVTAPTFKIQVFLDEYLPGPVGRTVAYEIRNAANTVVVQSGTVVLGAGGNASIGSNLAAGNYRIWVKGSHWLASLSGAVSFNTTIGTASAYSTTLTNGDCDNNNAVELSDYLQLAASFDLSTGDAGFDPQADLDGNGTVELSDYLILAASFDQIGAP